MQTAGFSGAGDFAGRDVQAGWVRPISRSVFAAIASLAAFLLGKRGGLRVFLCVALEDARADQISSAVYGMHQRFSIVNNEFAGNNGVFEPEHEVFGGRGGLGG